MSGLTEEKQRNEGINMAKKRAPKTNKKPPVAKVNLQELRESRDGGQIALRGYSYQFLYSCYLILSSDTSTVFTLEGIEDIDAIKYSDGNKTIISNAKPTLTRFNQVAIIKKSRSSIYLEQVRLKTVIMKVFRG